jgi:hypothetical protein
MLWPPHPKEKRTQCILDTMLLLSPLLLLLLLLFINFTIVWYYHYIPEHMYFSVCNWDGQTICWAMRAAQTCSGNINITIIKMCSINLTEVSCVLSLPHPRQVLGQYHDYNPIHHSKSFHFMLQLKKWC